MGAAACSVQMGSGRGGQTTKSVRERRVATNKKDIDVTAGETAICFETKGGRGSNGMFRPVQGDAYVRLHSAQASRLIASVIQSRWTVKRP